ncbi:Peptidoglycan-N-acetylglucosamine deacetylase [Lentibacillus sp. JNUCC-1]|uniref:polysaccharide deacetylase family protein n=1 Tax=Lentibacillus sp. JNUCC-1 TaxID=2654513 RepID=UPI0012E844AC|nr:polysaccharide deacetylase family protein [Lentibacillus sp. JNUCC-1]MUV36270.1 Peptidoglycan-N-acetylglucosamine deacetylase [Lentibacillus sp. JNUCC-1]
MRKIYVFILALIFVVSACSSPDTSETSGNENETDTNAESTENATTDNETNESEDTGDATEDENTEDSENNQPVEDEQTNEEIEPMYEVSQESWHIKPITDDANEKIVLLTIDDVPDEHALEMAKTLKELDAGAIFFVNGHFMETEEKKEIVKKIHDMGFLIGNHTYSHKSLPDLDKETQKEEIIQVNDMVEEIIGERPAFFRAPFGQNTDYSKQIADKENMVLMNWVYGYDWNKEYMSREALTDIMLNTELLGNGANLLMHDRDWTNAALHDIVVGLRDQGYEIVDPELIKTIK